MNTNHTKVLQSPAGKLNNSCTCGYVKISAGCPRPPSRWSIEMRSSIPDLLQLSIFTTCPFECELIQSEIILTPARILAERGIATGPQKRQIASTKVKMNPTSCGSMPSRSFYFKVTSSGPDGRRDRFLARPSHITLIYKDLQYCIPHAHLSGH